MSTSDILTPGKGVEMSFLRNNKYLTRVASLAEPNDDLFVVPSHWHETHDEYIFVAEGKLQITIGSTVKIYTPEDGEACIPKGTVHSLTSLKGVPFVALERTNPMDSDKEMFFRELLSDGKLPTSVLELMSTFYHGDTVIALPGHFMAFEKMVVTILGYYIAPLFGYQRKLKTL